MSVPFGQFHVGSRIVVDSPRSIMSSSPASEGAVSGAGEGMTTGKGCGIAGGVFDASNRGDQGHPGYPGLRDGWPQSKHRGLESSSSLRH